MRARLGRDSHRLAQVSDTDLLAFNPFAGDKDSPDWTNEHRAVVRTRKPQDCLMHPPPRGAHPIPVGARAVSYRAILGHKWHGFYLCADCIAEEVRRDH